MFNMWALLYINSEKRGYKLGSIRHLKLPGKIRTQVKNKIKFYSCCSPG